MLYNNFLILSLNTKIKKWVAAIQKRAKGNDGIAGWIYSVPEVGPEVNLRYKSE